MLIHEAAKISGLTKKAIAYYERQGLIAVHYNSNGYRDFEAEDIRTLKEISALRKLGLHVQDIKHVLTSGDKRRALRNCLLTKERQLRQDQDRRTGAFRGGGADSERFIRGIKQGGL